MRYLIYTQNIFWVIPWRQKLSINSIGGFTRHHLYRDTFFIFIKIFSITFNYAVFPSVWRNFYPKLHCDHETLFQNKWLFPHIPLLVFYLISLRQRLSSWFAEYFYSSIFETNNTGEISPLNIWWTLEGTTSCLYQVKQVTVFISRCPE